MDEEIFYIEESIKIIIRELQNIKLSIEALKINTDVCVCNKSMICPENKLSE